MPTRRRPSTSSGISSNETCGAQKSNRRRGILILKTFLMGDMLKWLKLHRKNVIGIFCTVLILITLQYVFYMYFPVMAEHTVFHGRYEDCRDITIKIPRAYSISFNCKMSKEFNEITAGNLMLRLKNLETKAETLLVAGEYNAGAQNIDLVYPHKTVICSAKEHLDFFDPEGAYYLPPGDYSVALEGDFSKHDDCILHVSFFCYASTAVERGMK